MSQDMQTPINALRFYKKQQNLLIFHRLRWEKFVQVKPFLVEIQSKAVFCTEMQPTNKGVGGIRGGRMIIYCPPQCHPVEPPLFAVQKNAQ